MHPNEIQLVKINKDGTTLISEEMRSLSKLIENEPEKAEALASQIQRQTTEQLDALNVTRKLH